MLMNDDLVMCLSVWGSTLAACDNEPLVHAQSISQIDQHWGLLLGEKKISDFKYKLPKLGPFF